METIVKFKFKVSEKEGKELYKDAYLKLHNNLLDIGLKEKEFGYYEGDIVRRKQFDVLFALYYDMFLMSRFEYLTVNLTGKDEDVIKSYTSLLKKEKDSFKKRAPHILEYFNIE